MLRKRAKGDMKRAAGRLRQVGREEGLPDHGKRENPHPSQSAKGAAPEKDYAHLSMETLMR